MAIDRQNYGNGKRRELPCQGIYPPLRLRAISIYVSRTRRAIASGQRFQFHAPHTRAPLLDGISNPVNAGCGRKEIGFRYRNDTFAVCSVKELGQTVSLDVIKERVSIVRRKHDSVLVSRDNPRGERKGFWHGWNCTRRPPGDGMADAEIGEDGSEPQRKTQAACKEGCTRLLLGKRSHNSARGYVIEQGSHTKMFYPNCTIYAT